jgi:hypothetical protein
MSFSGIYVQDDRSPFLQAIARGLGRLLGTTIPFAPYLFASHMIYRYFDHRQESWLWSSFMHAIIGGLLFLAEWLLIRKLAPWKESKQLKFASLFILVMILLLFLHIWVAQAGLSSLLHKYRDRAFFSGLFTCVFAIIAILRLVKRDLKAFV